MISALRPHQWVKNTLIALPSIALHRFDLAIIPAFVSFSLAASAVYLCNDIKDLPHDRRHPRKRKRPIAKGTLPIGHAVVVTVVLLATAAAIAVMLPLTFAVSLGLYLILAGAYSLRLKRIIMLDVVVLALLYGIRVLAGAEATGIALSHWLVGFCFFLFLCLALVKRTGEIATDNTFGRAYTSTDMPAMIAMMAAAGFVSVLMLALYIADVPPLYRHPELLWGICVVLTLWLGRVFVLTSRGDMHDDPVVFATTDWASWATAAATATIFWAAI